MNSIAESLHAVRHRIAAAADRAARHPNEITLVAVTKTHPVDVMLQAVVAGVTDVGENRVQEALDKKRGMEAAGAGLRWHLIGHLQTNKAKSAIEHFDLIHSVDSLALAQALNKHASVADKVQSILLQFNVSGEDTKFGANPRNAHELTTQVLQTCPSLRIDGFMTMAPFSDNPEDARPHFRALREVAQTLRTEFQNAPNFPATHLSMGMTGDFEVAIEEGATIVRIGSAIFGGR
ncbi:MAG: YggS family pyridoxal phosphate-dependent enzyme [Candidatus Sumerlaeaceae bacterium]